MSRLALGLDAPNRCDFSSRGRGEPGRLVVRWGSYRTVETRDRGSRDLCSRSRSAAAFSPEASAATGIRERPSPHRGAAGPATRRRCGPQSLPGRASKLPVDPHQVQAALSPEASAVTGTEALSAHA